MYYVQSRSVQSLMTPGCGLRINSCTYKIVSGVEFETTNVGCRGEEPRHHISVEFRKVFSFSH